MFYFRPKNGKVVALYLRAKRRPTECEWYDDVRVGINTITKVVKNMCSKAGLEGFYSNHSLCATAAIRMYAANLPEQLICQRTGHRVDAVRSYKRSSDAQHQSQSDGVQGVKRKQLTGASEANVCNTVENLNSGPASSSVKIEKGDMLVELNI